MTHTCGELCPHDSDCAVHNAPALLVCACDCDARAALEQQHAADRARYTTTIAELRSEIAGLRIMLEQQEAKAAQLSTLVEQKDAEAQEERSAAVRAEVRAEQAEADLAPALRWAHAAEMELARVRFSGLPSPPTGAEP